jgi:hypothetical protein
MTEERVEQLEDELAALKREFTSLKCVIDRKKPGWKIDRRVGRLPKSHVVEMEAKKNHDALFGAIGLTLFVIVAVYTYHAGPHRTDFTNRIEPDGQERQPFSKERSEFFNVTSEDGEYNIECERVYYDTEPVTSWVYCS